MHLGRLIRTASLRAFQEYRTSTSGPRPPQSYNSLAASVHAFDARIFIRWSSIFVRRLFQSGRLLPVAFALLPSASDCSQISPTNSHPCSSKKFFGSVIHFTDPRADLGKSSNIRNAPRRGYSQPSEINCLV